ncbi:MAG: HD domain-containing protein [Pseudobacter sp.]|uniref:HD domain-containing protein n=1 Tax=Pseudobacter sp. TaxID=2045420 RepID=UPI003F80184C
MKSILDKVEQFAAAAHEGQRRKFRDEPYINHPVRVMQLCRAYSNDLPVLAAALLHDVLEDTAVTADQIGEFLTPLMDAASTDKTLKLVDELTDRFVKANYPGWNRRKRKAKEQERLSNTSAEAQTIKYADIIDNSTEFARAETDFAEVFLRECNSLLKKMTKGNPELYKKAQDTVLAQLELLR